MTHADAAPRPLMLGKGWFPDQLGGLDRYYRDLLESLPEAGGIVVGHNAGGLPARVRAVSDHGRPLPLRLFALWRACQRPGAAFDVVDAHFALYALLPLWLGRWRRAPVVLHFHGPWAAENRAAGDGSAWRGWARTQLERLAYRRAAEAVVLTSAFRQVLVERYGVDPWRISVEPPGVDLDRFTPGDRAQARARLGLARDAFVVASVRRLEARMGLEVLIEAWARAIPDLPEGSRLLIAGSGPRRDALQAMIDRHQLQDAATLLGRVGDDRLVDLYRAADVAVVPSLEHEGFGLVVLEAAACGTPSVVTAVGGLPEAVASLDPSLVVAPGDAEALRGRLLRTRLERPSRQATRDYAEQHAWKEVAERHRRIIRRAAHGQGERDRLRVVYLDHVARLSGGEIALLRLLPHLDRVSPHVILAEDGPLVGQLHVAGISTEVIPLVGTVREVSKDEAHVRVASPRVAAGTAAYVLRLATRLRALRPDLVHTNSLKAGIYGSLAARLAGIPVVWHVRDRIAEDYLPRPAVTLVRRMSRHLATAVVANSHTTMETVRPAGDGLVVYSVLPEVLTRPPARAPRAPGPLTFGVVGRLSPWKGQDVFLRAFARAFPSGQERAVLVGGALFGEDGYADRLPRLAAELGIADRVSFRGHRTDVWEELSRIDVLVHSSITPEPFGQVILEGMAAGVPVVAADAGGPAEILTHDVTGLLYRRADPDAMAAAMLRATDEELRDRLTTAARAALDPYSPPVVAEQLQELYEAVASRSAVR